ncbi:hypothetical protein K474DRAFT_1366592 [Panus rudis PR-1116 ss-1]|nr:hypothetical protein K474DRAFT_1366592 [Panus rudis PR-1116 ss-1]
MEFFVDTYPEEIRDPFRPVFSTEEYNLRSGQNDTWRSTHEHLTTYLASQLSRQHRTFTFALSFFGRLVRFLRVDRAGVIVSSTVNYAKAPRLLAEFFWRYSHMSAVERGFDPCVTSASDTERRNLARAVFQYVRHVETGQARRLPNILRTLSKDYPAYKISVVSESTGVETDYIVRRSFTGDRSLFGRGTRGFVALKLDECGAGASSDDLSRQLVFLKDSWRIDEEGMDAEADVYEELKEHEVSHIPTLIAAGDVYSDHEYDENPQRSLTQDWAAMNKRWNRRNLSLTAYTHHRLVQRLAYPLETVKNARELAQVVRDALECAIEAYMKARRLHRDISSSNVMLCVEDTGEVRGVLNDWDISRQLSEDSSADKSTRVGTWRFMSINLLQYPKKAHGFLDDLESVLWVLLFIALCHFEHTGGFRDDLFDDYDEGFEEGPLGGDIKLTNLHRGAGSFLCPALDELIKDVSGIWREYYALQYSREANNRYDELHDKLVEDPRKLLAPFDKALANSPDSEAWVHSDWVPRHYPRLAHDRRQSSSLGTITDASPNSRSSGTPPLKERGHNAVDSSSPLSTPQSLKRPRDVGGADEIMRVRKRTKSP